MNFIKNKNDETISGGNGVLVIKRGDCYFTVDDSGQRSSPCLRSRAAAEASLQSGPNANTYPGGSQSTSGPSSPGNSPGSGPGFSVGSAPAGAAVSAGVSR